MKKISCPVELPGLGTTPVAAPKGGRRRQLFSRSFFAAVFLATGAVSFAQSDYKVVTVIDGGTISGTVKWSGPVPRLLAFPITKDAPICDPEANKTTDLERLIVGPPGWRS